MSLSGEICVSVTHIMSLEYIVSSLAISTTCLVKDLVFSRLIVKFASSNGSIPAQFRD